MTMLVRFAQMRLDPASDRPQQIAMTASRLPMTGDLTSVSSAVVDIRYVMRGASSARASDGFRSRLVAFANAYGASAVGTPSGGEGWLRLRIPHDDLERRGGIAGTLLLRAEGFDAEADPILIEYVRVGINLRDAAGR